MGVLLLLKIDLYLLDLRLLLELFLLLHKLKLKLEFTIKVAHPNVPKFEIS